MSASVNERIGVAVEQISENTDFMGELEKFESELECLGFDKSRVGQKCILMPIDENFIHKTIFYNRI